MPRQLPPLNALRAFEAAGRHLSFTRAAAELNVTPAAVGHQVKALEERLEVPLFRRLTRALRLTHAGQAALPAISQGFDMLAQGVEQMRAHAESGVLTKTPLRSGVAGSNAFFAPAQMRWPSVATSRTLGRYRV